MYKHKKKHSLGQLGSCTDRSGYYTHARDLLNICLFVMMSSTKGRSKNFEDLDFLDTSSVRSGISKHCTTLFKAKMKNGEKEMPL